MIEFNEILMDTKNKIDFIDITERAKRIVKESKIKNGFLLAYTQHTTSSVKVHEFETEHDRALIKDSLDFLEKIAPSNAQYRHDKSNVDNRPNTHAHLKSLLMNSSETIPIKAGELLLGKWQALYFVEMDGPREKRKVIIEIVGE